MLFYFFERIIINKVFSNYKYWSRLAKIVANIHIKNQVQFYGDTTILVIIKHPIIIIIEYRSSGSLLIFSRH